MADLQSPDPHDVKRASSAPSDCMLLIDNALIYSARSSNSLTTNLLTAHLNSISLGSEAQIKSSFLELLNISSTGAVATQPEPQPWETYRRIVVNYRKRGPLNAIRGSAGISPSPRP